VAQEHGPDSARVLVLERRAPALDNGPEQAAHPHRPRLAVRCELRRAEEHVDSSSIPRLRKAR
jgi:hypothetical protein